MLEKGALSFIFSKYNFYFRIRQRILTILILINISTNIFV